MAPRSLHCISHVCPPVTHLVVRARVGLVGPAAAVARMPTPPPLIHSHSSRSGSLLWQRPGPMTWSSPLTPLDLPPFFSAFKCRVRATCASHRCDFVPLGFSVFGSFGPAALELLVRICRRCRIHARIEDRKAHAWVHRRLFFAVTRGVADQFVGRRLDSFGG